MTRPLRLTAEATHDLALAERWYQEAAPQLLASFEGDVASVLRRITERPEMYQEVMPSVRRALLRRFPFSIFYRILPGTIEVLAVLHHSRSPATWRRRARLGPEALPRNGGPSVE